MSTENHPVVLGTPPSADDQIEVIKLRHALEDENVLTFTQGEALLDAYVAVRAELTRLRAERDILKAERDYYVEAVVLARDALVSFSNRAGWLPQQQAFSTTMTEIERELAECVAILDKALPDAALTFRAAQSARYTALLIDLRALVEQWKERAVTMRTNSRDTVVETLIAQYVDATKRCAEELLARLSHEPH